MKTFRTLELASDFYQLSEKSLLTGNLKDQLLRAASSIALNLAEGNAKPSIKEKKRFYQIAYASLRECQAIFKISGINDETLLDRADHLGACLYKLNKAEITVNEN